ncbi:MAG: STAS domain-containing protein [Alphaproteobacteria bacterium]|nr:MAG: STAS domain-containing protein [Alphaproteobacteria bacterium]
MMILPAIVDFDTANSLRIKIDKISTPDMAFCCDGHNVLKLTTWGLQALLAADRDLQANGKKLGLTRISPEFSQALEDFGCKEQMERWSQISNLDAPSSKGSSA